MSNHNSGLQRSGNILSFLMLTTIHRCITEKEENNWKFCKYTKECLKAFIYLFKCKTEKSVKVLVG